MNLEEKLKVFKERGYTYNSETGDIIGPLGICKCSNKNNYIQCGITYNKKPVKVYAHQLGYYLYYNESPKNQIDHINGIRKDNRILNLRVVTSQENHFNNHYAKGYYYYKAYNKWSASLKLNRKSIFLGYFDTPEEARDAYLNAKKIYHIL